MPSGTQQDVLINLKLVPDTSNANVVQQITQVTVAAYSRIGSSAEQAQQTAAQASVKAAVIIRTNAESAAASWEKGMQRAGASGVKAHDDQIAASKRLASQHAATAEQHERAAAKQEALAEKALKGYGELAGHVGGLAKSVAVLGGANEESLDKMAKQFAKFKTLFEVFSEGWEVFKKINEQLKLMKELAAAAAVEERMLAAAQAALNMSGGTGGALGSAASGGAGEAAAAEGGLSAMGAGLAESAASGAAIAAPIAATVAAVVALQEIFARVTGIGEGIAGATIGWYEATEAVRKSTEKIAQLQENRTKVHEFLKDEGEREEKGEQGRMAMIGARAKQTELEHLGDDSSSAKADFWERQLKLSEQRLVNAKEADKPRTFVTEERVEHKGLWESVKDNMDWKKWNASTALYGPVGQGVLNWWNQAGDKNAKTTEEWIASGGATTHKETTIAGNHAAVEQTMKERNHALEQLTDAEKERYEVSKRNTEELERQIDAQRRQTDEIKKQKELEKKKYESSLSKFASLSQKDQAGVLQVAQHIKQGTATTAELQWFKGKNLGEEAEAVSQSGLAKSVGAKQREILLGAGIGVAANANDVEESRSRIAEDVLKAKKEQSEAEMNRHKANVRTLAKRGTAAVDEEQEDKSIQGNYALSKSGIAEAQGASGAPSATHIVGELRREGEQTRRAFKEYHEAAVQENKKLREEIGRNAQRNRTSQ